MVKCSLLCLFVLVVLGLPILGAELPQVLQPNTSAYSASEVAALTQAITTLTTMLNGSNLASRRYFAANDWSSSNFAAYTAGILTGEGYDTEIVSGPGWSDGTHTWVLVGIPLGSKTAWIPVEASPLQGQEQQVLGRVPTTTATTGDLWFDTPYTAFTTLVQLPPNMAPVAKLRPPALTIRANENLKFMGLGSYDPDGEIVLYQWDFGNGSVEVTADWTIHHEFRKDGSVVVTLTVVDDRGSMNSTAIKLRAVTVDESKVESGPASGCGCGE